MQKRFGFMGALVFALSLFVGDRGAEASYNYTTSFVLSSPTAGVSINNAAGTASLGGVTITFSSQNGNKAVPSVNSLNLGDINVTAGATAQTFVVNFTDNVAIQNAPPPGSNGNGTLAFTGTITLTNVSATTGTVTASNLTVTTASTSAGGNTFGLSGLSYSFPTVNGGGGNVSGIVTSSTVIPEPTSVVMLGLGLGTLGLVRFRRRFQAA